MESVTVTYLGVAVCSDAQLAEGDDQGARIATQQPMPVGTDLEITVGETVRRARVASVAEVRDAGMRVVYFEPGHTPPPQPAPPIEPAVETAAETLAERNEDAPTASSPPAEPKPKRRKKKSE